MGLLSMFGLGDKSESITNFMEKGAVIIDVRTVGEYKEGHIKGSKNIPLDTIASKIQEIKKLNKPVIACCRSGMRSAQATSILKQNGIEVLNGGGWESLQRKL
jgi:phage shock protein E